MRAVAPYDPEVGGESPIRLVDLEDPVLEEGEIVVDVRATALNQADLLQMRGLYPPPAGESAVPGLECSGVVSAVAEGAERFAVGDRVMALLAGGGHATRVAVPEGQVMAMPEGWSFVDGAALPEAALTSWTNLVYEGRLLRSQTVLITAAASGVGTFAVQLARFRGARVFVAGRSLDRLQVLRSLGADECFQLDDGLAAAVRAANEGRGVDLVMEMVAGAQLNRSLAALRDRGRLILVGLLGGPRAEVDLGVVLRRRLVVRGSVLRGRSRGEKAGLVRSFETEAGDALGAGLLRPIVDRVVPFDDFERAYAALREGGVLGKIVVEIGDDQAPADGPGGR